MQCCEPVKTSFPAFSTGYAPSAADPWADRQKSSSARVSVERTGANFGKFLAQRHQARTLTRRRLWPSSTPCLDRGGTGTAEDFFLQRHRYSLLRSMNGNSSLSP